MKAILTVFLKGFTGGQSRARNEGGTGLGPIETYYEAHGHNVQVRSWRKVQLFLYLNENLNIHDEKYLQIRINFNSNFVYV